MVRRILQPLLLTALLTACYHVPSAKEQADNLERATGLRALETDGSSAPVAGKIHNGYPVIVRLKMGDVWGRFGARMTMGEIGRHLGGIVGILTGQYHHMHGNVVGSPLDRLLSYAIGQPLSVIVVMDHGKNNAPRLDILSDFSTIMPEDPQPKAGYVSFSTGSIYSKDKEFSDRILADKALVSKLENFRSQYIRVDDKEISFLFAGSENEFSGMIRNFGSYEDFVNGILDSLASISDKLPSDSVSGN